MPDPKDKIGVQNLLHTAMMAREDGANELVTPAHAPASLDDFEALTRFLFTVATQLDI